MTTPALLLISALAFWPFGHHGNNPTNKNVAPLQERLLDHYVIPKVDLPRGTYFIIDGDVDFADIEQSVAAHGKGPRSGDPVKISEVSGNSKSVRILLRHLSEDKRDPDSLALVLKNKKSRINLVNPDEVARVLANLLDFQVDEARLEAEAKKPDYHLTVRPSPAPAAPPPSPPALSPPTPAPAWQTAPSAPPPIPSAAPAPVSRPLPPDLSELGPGLSKKELFSLFGDPLKSSVRFEGETVVEMWYYEWSDKSSALIFMRDGIVSKVKRF